MTKEELHKSVMQCLVENGIYRGIKFMFLCELESGNEIIDAIKLADYDHDAEFDMDYAIAHGWVLCRNREDALDHADREWNKQFA